MKRAIYSEKYCSLILDTGIYQPLNANKVPYMFSCTVGNKEGAKALLRQLGYSYLELEIVSND